MMTGLPVPPAWASVIKLPGAIMPSFVAGLKMPTTNVGIPGFAVAAGITMVLAIVATSLGAHSVGGKPGRKPPGKPSVTNTMATRWSGVLTRRCFAYATAPVSAGPVGV